LQVALRDLVPAGTAARRTLQLGAADCGKSGLGFAYGQEAAAGRLDGFMATYLETAASLQALSHKTLQHAEAVTAFLEKRAPRFIDE